MHEFTFPDTISRVEWSPEGSHIFAALYKRGLVVVKSLTDS